MKIVFDGLIYQKQARGGIPRVYDNLLPCMCDLDADLRIRFVVSGRLLKSLPDHRNISHLDLESVRVAIRRIFRSWRIWHRLYDLIYEITVGVLLGGTNNKIWLSTYYADPPMNWRGKSAVVVHDLIHELFSNLLPGNEKFIAAKKKAIESADVVICNSKTTALDVQRLYAIPSEKIRVTYWGRDEQFTARSGEQLNFRRHQPFILYVGNRGRYKNFSTLLTAFSGWPDNRNVQLLVVGPHWRQDEIALLRDTGCQDKIELLAGLDDIQLCDLYNQAAAFVYPSLYEGFGFPLLEAMSCGCPIVASRIPSTLEVAGDVPIYFDAESAADLLQALDQAMVEGRSSARVADGLSLVNQYSWEKTAREFLAAVQTLHRPMFRPVR
jgi:glycosyltransferase involved in cell wall biosynthesis